ncbi:unnamed protein product [Gongylonema pulchrum]|uniref:BAR domain-containing protein n=1 Tax=Gongylonema pulchrum TaxID=637853 RepID=A0A183ELW5_9BILA|nr:unnamed protein product [Gongylonema pulchrum]
MGEQSMQYYRDAVLYNRGTALYNRTKKGGIWRRWLGFREGSADQEKTQMSPEFKELTAKYDTYKECSDLLVQKLEACIQQNKNVIDIGKIVNEPNENPYEKLANSFSSFSNFFPPEKHESIRALASTAFNLGRLQRAQQLEGRRSIRHLRRFFATEYKELMDERAKLEKARKHMDRMKHEVKVSKTTEKIEKYAVLYEQAVEEFDAQARRTIILLNQLPNIKNEHTVSFFFSATLIIVFPHSAW